MRTLSRDLAVGLCWGAAVLAAGLAIGSGHAQEHDRLVSRFADRAEVSATFVSAYVDDIFSLERRMAASMTQGQGGAAQLAESRRLAGFTVAILLDPRGRVLAASPSDPALIGVDLAAKYEHLASALSGEPTVSGVVASAVEEVPVVAFALPLAGGDRGVLSAGFRFDEGPLASFLATNPIAGTRGYVIDEAGATAAFAGDGATSSLDGIDPDTLRDVPIMADGRVVAAAAIEGTPWRLVLTAPEQAVVAPTSGNDWVAWLVLALAALATLVGMCVLRSVSASRRRNVHALAESEQRFRVTVDNAPIGMTLVDLDGRYIRPNARFCRMLGYTAEQLAGMAVQDITHPDDLDLDSEQLRRLLAGEITHYEMEKRFICGDDSTVWARMSTGLVRNAEGEPLHFVTQVEDVTEMRAAQETLERRALYDALTGLANRSLLIDRLTHALDDERRVAGRVAVAFCDLDHFKRINDSLGHHAGDVVLQAVARRLEGAVRGGDTVARIGGASSS